MQAQPLPRRALVLRMAQQGQRAQQQRRQRQLGVLGLAVGLDAHLQAGQSQRLLHQHQRQPDDRAGRHALGVQRIPAAQLAQTSGQIDQMAIELPDPTQPVLLRQIGPLQAPAHHRQLHACHRDRPEQVMAQRRQHPHQDLVTHARSHPVGGDRRGSPCLIHGDQVLCSKSSRCARSAGLASMRKNS
ncbi:hypothetical protein X805_35330 [Sphaerotilus natans subsp. natans DSM 6575]|uniref:Uncharacterized protein n=1 Tax=Sphaerotilus natans subsp. natans DSM 6575 TaxID=1286631 RepID=A0A059KI35_9BURK|nr:hypothetical protein X805_35330 [Sphaerotilus natans subsp. natans DSM 6575]